MVTTVDGDGKDGGSVLVQIGDCRTSDALAVLGRRHGNGARGSVVFLHPHLDAAFSLIVISRWHVVLCMEALKGGRIVAIHAYYIICSVIDIVFIARSRPPHTHCVVPVHTRMSHLVVLPQQRHCFIYSSNINTHTSA